MMHTTHCVVTVDSTRARFFFLETPELREVDGGPSLVEEPEALVYTELETRGRELWTDPKTGRNAGAAMAHGYDDHRMEHLEEFRRRFAKLVADEILKKADDWRVKSVVLVAEKQILGHVREALHLPPQANFNVQELAKDLSRLTPQELQSHLATEGLLPARQRPKGGH